MIGKIFSVLAITSTVTAIIMGNCAELCKGIIEGASKSVSVTLSLMGMMALWNGIMNVLKESGAIGALSRLMRPLLKWIFPSSFKNETATEEITACISANLLGISNTSLVSKLKSRTQFTQEEILKATSILKIPTEEITSYFFSIKS